MARIAGINLPKDKRIEAALTAIHGIGRSLSKTILLKTKIDLDTKVKDLTEKEIETLRKEITKLPTEGDLQRKVALDIKRLKEIGSYRGFRHARRMPVRGQRTRQNCRTRKGNVKGTVANKKIATK